MKILVIEDERETAEYLRQGLTEVGHSVSLAHDGRDGLARAASEPWDLLVVDKCC